MSDTSNAPDIAEVRAVIEEHFPGLWPAVDAGLSTAATLLLEANANPMALVYVGGPSSSKTTVADMFVGHVLCYRSDKFTPAAFVSHAAFVNHHLIRLADDVQAVLTTSANACRSITPLAN